MERPHDFWELWTWREVAQALKVSRFWVYAKAARGQLPSLRICGALRFDPQAIRDRVLLTAQDSRVVAFGARTDATQ